MASHYLPPIDGFHLNIPAEQPLPLPSSSPPQPTAEERTALVYQTQAGHRQTPVRLTFADWQSPGFPEHWQIEKPVDAETGHAIEKTDAVYRKRLNSRRKPYYQKIDRLFKSPTFKGPFPQDREELSDPLELYFYWQKAIFNIQNIASRASPIQV